jgi:hypothetical protein
MFKPGHVKQHAAQHAIVPNNIKHLLQLLKLGCPPRYHLSLTVGSHRKELLHPPQSARQWKGL